MNIYLASMFRRPQVRLVPGTRTEMVRPSRRLLSPAGSGWLTVHGHPVQRMVHGNRNRGQGLLRRESVEHE